MRLDLDTYLAVPRLGPLLVSQDGSRVLVAESTPTSAGTAFATAVLSVDPVGERPARRLTAPREGDALVGMLPDGGALMVSARKDPGAATDADEDDARLWVLPAEGEPQHLVDLPSAPHSVVVAHDAGTLVLLVDVLPGATSLDEDREGAKRRKDAGTAALLFEDYPIRLWDHHLGPRRPRLVALPAPVASPDGTVTIGPAVDLTGDVGQSLVEAETSVLDDGNAVVTTWRTPLGRGEHRADVVLVPLDGGQRRVVAAVDGIDHGGVAVSPDGRWVAAGRSRVPSAETAADIELWLYPLDPLDVSEPRRLAADLDRWPASMLWSRDGGTIWITADDEGRAAVYAVDVAGGATRRVSRDGALADVHLAGNSPSLVAMRSTIGSPPEIVALDAAATDGIARVLHAPALPGPLDQRVEEVTATAEDGAPLRAWLVLPGEQPSGEPAPLLVLIHGGPLGSWNAWQWRWQPAMFTARGYAVLLPDPALSTGYGQHMIERGWRQWGGTPYTDVMALTDAAVARPDVDETRTGVLGGSYGGYLTNWVVGHTTRFSAAVTHASLWAMDQFQGTTDDAVAWEREWGDSRTDPEHYARWSPHTYLDAISTPTLVIHGECDHRVPVSEALRLWTDLQRRGVTSQLLYLPDENHWVLKPGNVRVWYSTVLAWLDTHVLGRPYQRPDLV